MKSSLHPYLASKAIAENPPEQIATPSPELERSAGTLQPVCSRLSSPHCGPNEQTRSPPIDGRSSSGGGGRTEAVGPTTDPESSLSATRNLLKLAVNPRGNLKNEPERRHNGREARRVAMETPLPAESNSQTPAPEPVKGRSGRSGTVLTDAAQSSVKALFCIEAESQPAVGTRSGEVAAEGRGGVPEGKHERTEQPGTAGGGHQEAAVAERDWDAVMLPEVALLEDGLKLAGGGVMPASSLAGRTRSCQFEAGHGWRKACTVSPMTGVLNARTMLPCTACKVDMTMCTDDNRCLCHERDRKGGLLLILPTSSFYRWQAGCQRSSHRAAHPPGC